MVKRRALHIFSMRSREAGFLGFPCFLPTIALPISRAPGLCVTRTAICSLQRDESSKEGRKGGEETKKKKKPRAKASPKATPITDVSVGEKFIGTICDVGPAESTWVDIGVATVSGKTVTARLRHRKGRHTDSTESVGGLVPVYVRKLNHASARIEVFKGLPPVKREPPLPENVRMLSSVQTAEKLTGQVIGTGPYGAVVDVNIFRCGKGGRVVPSHGLLPRKRFREEWACDVDQVIRDDVERIIRKGDEIDVFVRIANAQSAFLLLDTYEIEEEELQRQASEKKRMSRRRRRRPSPDILKIGEQRNGTVREKVKFGLFIDIGVKTDGLIHYSEMGSKHRKDWKDVIDIGTSVSVEVLGVQDNRISLRLLSLSQDAEAMKDAEPAAYSPTARPKNTYKREVEAFRIGQDMPPHSEGKSHPMEPGASSDETGIQIPTSPETPHDEAEEDGNGEEEKEDADDVELFSDEYFEDKYGY